MKIQVDSRKCGGGKTLFGIYPLVEKLVDSNESYIIATPSLVLQEQYKDHIRQLHVINCNATDSNNVTDDLVKYMERNKPELSITHSNLLKSSNLPNKSKYHLIVDEAMDNLYTSSKLQIINNELCTLNWSKHFILENPTEMAGYLNKDVESIPDDVYCKLQVTKENLKQYAFFGQHDTYKQLINPNYDLVITPRNYAIMTGIIDKEEFVIHGMRGIDVLTGWKSVYIAAAAFENTKMAAWMKYHGLNYTTVEEFVPHTNKVKIHYMPIPLWTNTKRKSERRKDNSCENTFIEYVNNVTKHEKVLVLKNNDSKNKINQAINLTHNEKGINKEEYINTKHIAIQSAIIPSNDDMKFQEILFGNDKKSIYQAYAVYNYYQTIMRSIIRQSPDEEANIFVMDATVAQLLQYYFSNSDLIPIDMDNEEVDPSRVYNKEKSIKKSKADKLEKYKTQMAELIEKVKGRAMSNAERSAKRKIKANIAKYS